MGRQWNTIIESLGPLSGGTGLSINANLTELEALLTTLQADVADGITITNGSSVVTNGTLAQITSASSVLTAGTLTNGTVTANAGTGTFVISDKGATGEGTITSFTSASSDVLKASNSNRKLLTVFNEGNGTIFILLGSGTASTANYSLRLLAGDYYELEKYTGEVNAIFATAGTAKITEIT
jgi:hypothetical protein